jgi:hypothetical protein
MEAANAMVAPVIAAASCRGGRERPAIWVAAGGRMTRFWLQIHRGEAPLIVSFPHTGTRFPPAIEARLVSPWLARKDADWWIDSSMTSPRARRHDGPHRRSRARSST